MRILFVIRNLTHGGAETQVIRLANELSSQQHEIAIYTMSKNNPRMEELNHNVLVQVDHKRMAVDPSVLWRLHRFIKTWKADIVHGFLYDGNFYSRVASIGTNTPALNSERNSFHAFNRGQRIAQRLSWNLAAGVVANSFAGINVARNIFPLHKKHMHVVWNGIDLEQINSQISINPINYKELFFNNNQVKVACCVGNIKPAKDHLLALEVADLLTNTFPHWKVLFVGGDLEATNDIDHVLKVKNTWKEKNLRDRSVFCGQRSDAIEIIRQSDVLFSTSLFEGFPNVVLEAMAIGTPVISTEYSDIQRILPNAWQVSSTRSPQELVKNIIRADKERKQVQSDQQQWIRTNATIKKSVSDLLQVYTQYLR